MNFKKKYYHHLIEGRSKNLENTLKGKYRFEKAYYLLPFSGINFINHESKVIDNKWIPDFLKGHARSIIAIAKK